MATWADLVQRTLVRPILELLVLGSFHGSGISKPLRQLPRDAGNP